MDQAVGPEFDPAGDLAISDLGETKLKNIAEPVRVYALEVRVQADAKVTPPSGPAQHPAASVPRRRSAPSALALAHLLTAAAAAGFGHSAQYPKNPASVFVVFWKQRPLVWSTIGP